MFGKTIWRKWGKGTVSTERRPMTKEEMAVFDRAFGRMDKAFREMDKAFAEFDKIKD
jgi:hypothetical protein